MRWLNFDWGRRGEGGRSIVRSGRVFQLSLSLQKTQWGNVPNKNMEDVCSVTVETHPYSAVQQMQGMTRSHVSALLKGFRAALC